MPSAGKTLAIILFANFAGVFIAADIGMIWGY